MIINRDLISEFIKTDHILHNWGRFIGRIGKLYIPQKTDDSNTNFSWVTNRRELQGRFFKSPKGVYYLAYNVGTLAFIFYNENTIPVKQVHTLQKSYTEVGDEIISFLNELGLDTMHFYQALIFRYPEQFNKKGISKTYTEHNILMWETLRTAANKNLAMLNQEMNKESEIRIWPTNFDTGIYYNYNGIVDQFAGFSPADEISEIPYFYNSFYYQGKKVFPTNYPSLTHGSWKTETWGGAILPILNFTSITDFTKAGALFLVESSKIMLTKLSI